MNFTYFLFILQGCILFLVTCQVLPKVPKIDGSYRSNGEIIFKYHNNEKTYQMYFEENYDKVAGRSSFFYQLSDSINVTLYKDIPRNQNWVTHYDLEGQLKCEIFDGKIFDLSEFPLQIYELLGGHDVFPLDHLLNLEDKNITKWPEKNQVYRDIPSLNFQHVIETLDNGTAVKFVIESYWSDGSQISPSKIKTVPLGFKVEVFRKRDDSFQQLTLQNINLFGFLHDDINEKAFLPIRGLVCPDVKDETKFPDLSSLKSFSFQAEVTLISQQKPTKNTLDFWLDSGLKLLQVEEHKDRLTTSIRSIFSSEQGAFYSYPLEDTVLRKSETQVGDIGRVTLPPESYIIDPRDKESYNSAAFFGTNKNKYVKTGTTVERGIPCDIFQTVRQDWPEISRNAETVWEWCFASGTNVIYPKNGFPLVSLRIKILKIQSIPNNWLVPGNSLSYHFYNMKKVDTSYLDAVAFDITPCFSDNHMELLQFKVDLSREIQDAVIKDTSNVYFNGAWKDAITVASKLKPTSLRVTRVRTDVPVAGSSLVVTFTLLDRNSKLPINVRRNEEELSSVIKTLKQAVDSMQIKIQWKVAEKTVILTSITGSLVPQAIANVVSKQSTKLNNIDDFNFMHVNALFGYKSNFEAKPDANVSSINLSKYLIAILPIGLLSTVFIIYLKYQRK